MGDVLLENVAYFGSASDDHGIAYSRESFHQLSRLNLGDRKRIKEALATMRTNDQLDEPLTATRRVRRFADGLRFIFERSGSALTVLAISGGLTAAPKGKDAQL